MSQPARRIAMFDSGLGGLSVYTALRAALPDADVFYAADTARMPYGDRPLAQVEGYARQMIARLRRYDPALLVIACGTTCSAFDASGYAPPGMPALAIVDCAIAAAASASQSGRVGVIATAATSASGIFERKLTRYSPNIRVTSVAAPKLVPLVESGAWASSDARRAVDEYCEPFRAAGCDAVILGCTHYPHLRRLFRESLGDGVAIIDPAQACAQSAQGLLASLAPGEGSLTFEVSGDAADFAARASELTGVTASALRRVDFSDQVE
ncbi:MAG: glutamate racemase [Candidatus Eremiobacteraeota bacterium]|nr:glutamate racemase [Candidatus Eremiobacteraeota bacterium]